MDALIPTKEKTFPFPAQLLFTMHEGNYAVNYRGSERIDFMRLSIVKPRRSGYNYYIGWMRVQTLHGDQWYDRAYIKSDGKYRMLSASMGSDRIAEMLSLVIVDMPKAAADFGHMLERCCRCGRTLTDERSRWYAIGPECEQYRPAFIEYIDGVRGEFVPSETQW